MEYSKSNILDAFHRATQMLFLFDKYDRRLMPKPGQAYFALPEEIRDKLKHLKSDYIKDLRI